jgi:hypothetical protein
MKRTFLRSGPGTLLFTTLLLGCSGGGSSTATTSTSSSSSSSGSTTTTTGTGGGSTTSSSGTGGNGGESTSVTTGTGGAGGAATTGTGGAGTTTGTGGGTTTTTGAGGAGTTTTGVGGAGTTTVGAGGAGGAGTTTGVGGAGTTTTTGAGGAPPLCVPGSTKACYTGPIATQDVGACKSGLQTCDAMGAAYGACVGDILPALENCASPADEDCSGSPLACTGTTQWSKVVGGSLDDEGAAAALDPQGNVLVAGYSTLAADFGCGMIDAGPNNSALLLKYSAAGSCIWSKTFGNAGVGNISETKGVATDAAGNVFLLGYIIGSVDFGGGALTSTTAGESDVLLAKFSPNGAHLWSKRFGGAGNQYARSVAVDSQGNAVITGYIFGTIDFGGGVLTSAGATDVYVAKFAPNGAHLWSKHYGNVSGQESFGVAVDAADNIVVVGTLKGTINFGGGNLTSLGLGDVFLAKLDPMGGHLWSKRFGDAMDQTGAAVTVDPAGNVIAVGGFAGTINFGGQNLVSAGGTDAWIASFSPNGTHLWSRAGAGTNNQGLSGVSSDVFGNVTATGFLSDSADFGGGSLPSNGGQDIVVARYSPTGTHLWSKSYGAAGTEVGRATASAATGEVFIAGLVTSPTDFGGGLMAGGGGEDIFLLKVAP